MSAAAVQDFDGASDCSHFSLVTPPSPPPTSSCGKCCSHDKAQGDDFTASSEYHSRLTNPVEKDHERAEDERRLPTKVTKPARLEAPEPCVHSLNAHSEYLNLKLAEAGAALERFQRSAGIKSAKANAGPARDDFQTEAPERQIDRRKQTVISLQEGLARLLRHLEPEGDRCVPVDTEAAFSGIPRENVPPTSSIPDDVKTNKDPIGPVDRQRCLELLKDDFFTWMLNANMAIPAVASDGTTGPPPRPKKKSKAYSEPPSPLNPEDYNMPPFSGPPVFDNAMLEYPPLLPLPGGPDYKAKGPTMTFEMRRWLRVVLLVCEIFFMMVAIVTVFKVPGLAGELLDAMHPRNKGRCVGFYVRG